jgi:hypothetical protein
MARTVFRQQRIATEKPTCRYQSTVVEYDYCGMLTSGNRYSLSRLADDRRLY